MKYESIIDTVYGRLKQMIINQEIKPGEIINQSKLSEKLGVSRTPLRQALGELEGEGFLGKSSRGWYAIEFTIKDMITLFEIRSLLEGLSCRKATPNMTRADVAYLKTLMEIAFEDYQKGDRDAYLKADIEFHQKIMDTAADAILTRAINSTKVMATSHIITKSVTLLEGRYLLEPEQSYKDHLEILEAFSQKDENLAEEMMRRHIQHALQRLREYEKLSSKKKQ